MARSTKFFLHRLRAHGRTIAIAAFVVACLGSVPATAGNLKTRLTWDFDGDHKTDLAVGGVSDSTFTIRVQLSNQPKPVFLKARITRQDAVNLSAIDVDQDDDIDIVLTGLALRPLVVWFNQGNGKFHKTSHWFFPPLYRDTGGQIRRAVQTDETDFATAFERPTVFLVRAPPLPLDLPAGDDFFPAFFCSLIDSRFRKDFSRGPPV
jgi:hypothetical protein